MNIIVLASSAISLILKTWEWVSGRQKRQIDKKRQELEEKSRQAQIDGDIDELRRARAEIEELDKYSNPDSR